MRLREITDLFGKGSDLGKLYNPGVDPEIQAAQAAQDGGGPQYARPTQSGDDQAAWDRNMAKHFNPDGTPKNPAAGKGSGNVSYSSDFKGKIRNKPIAPQLMKVLQSASAKTGLKVVIFSGGQDAKGRGTRRTGSTYCE